MVKGLDSFRRHFDGYADQFVLIGGTAATIAMEGAGLEFRATKDLDIVLHIEALKPAFCNTFWQFIEKGGYQIRETSDTGKPVLYRFQRPVDATFPFMLELFCRSPDGIRFTESSRLTPIPFDEGISSLSAILLDESYYRFILDGRRELDGLCWIGEDRLIPLKAHAWLDLSERKTGGEPVDSKNIRKHANDVIRLSQLSQRLQPAHGRDRGHDRHRHRCQTFGSVVVHARCAQPRLLRADERPRRPQPGFRSPAQSVQQCRQRQDTLCTDRRRGS